MDKLLKNYKQSQNKLLHQISDVEYSPNPSNELPDLNDIPNVNYST